MDGQHEFPDTQNGPRAAKPVEQTENRETENTSDDSIDTLYDVVDKEPPFPPNQLFDPSEELKHIRQLPPAERKTAIASFKEKFVYQSQGYGFLRNEIIQEVKSNPTFSRQDLQELAKKYSAQYGFPSSAHGKIETCIEELMAKKTKVEQIRKDIPDNKILCDQVFGFVPQGEFKVIQGPMTLSFVFSEPLDYARSRSLGGQTTDTDLKELSESSGGFLLKRSNRASRYNGIIVGVNEKYAAADVHSHEEQHAFHDILQKVTEKPIGREDVLFLNEDYLTSEEMTNILVPFFLNTQHDALLRAKDEILAFKQGGGFSDNEVIGHLTKSEDLGGLYDYTHGVRAEMVKAYQEYYKEPTQDLVNKVMREILIDNYKVTIEKAIQTFNQIKKHGYTNSQVVDLLGAVPIQKWQRMADMMGVDHYIEEPVDEDTTDYSITELIDRFSKPTWRYRDRKEKNAEETEREEDKQKRLPTDKRRTAQIDAIRRTLDTYTEEE